MRRGRLAGIPAGYRWGTLALALALAAALVWFFFFRSTPGAPLPQAPPRPALGKTVSYPDYSGALQKALSEVRAARSATGGERDKAIQRAITALDAVEGANVAPPGAGSLPAEIDNTRLLGELGISGADLQAVETSLSALADALEKQSSAAILAGTLDGASARAALQQVLADPAFDYERNLTPIQRLARWLANLTGQANTGDNLWRLLIALVAALVSGAGTYLASDRLSNRWARLALATLAGLAVGGIFYAGLGALGTTVEVLAAAGIIVAVAALALFGAGMRAASAPGKPRAISELAAILGMSAAEARTQAEEAAAHGDFRGAIRYRCLGVLLALDQAGKLAFDRTATDSEYLFRAPEGLQTQLQPLLNRFEAVWYGEAHAGHEEWVDYSRRAESVEAMA